MKHCQVKSCIDVDWFRVYKLPFTIFKFFVYHVALFNPGMVSAVLSESASHVFTDNLTDELKV
jgi:hypothetical protein